MSRTEEYYRYLATGKGTIPKPLTREEQYLYAICIQLSPEKLSFAKEYSESIDADVSYIETVLEQSECAYVECTDDGNGNITIVTGSVGE